MKLQVIASDELRKFGLPSFATPGSAAVDLRALLNSPSSTAFQADIDVFKYDTDGCVRYVQLHAGAQMVIDTGLQIHIGDPNYAGLVLPRSSSGRRGLVLANGTGLIDSDYQGSLLVTVWNRSDKTIEISDGERIAQYLITNVHQFDMEYVEAFSVVSERGEGAFGSTGTH